MSIPPEKLKMVFETLSKDLGEGFVATDIWTAAKALPLLSNHGFNSYPKAIALFNEVTRVLDKTLKGSEYPGLGNYYFIKLDNNHLAVVLSIDIYQQFILVDLSKTTMGILMSVVLPNLLNSLAEAELTETLAEAAITTTEAPVEAVITGSVAEADTAKQPRNPSTLREFFKAFTSTMYYADKDS